MNTAKTRSQARREGSALLTVIMLLTIATVAVGSILTATITYARQAHVAYCRDKAALLADAGLRAALVELNRQGDGAIEYDEAAAFFSLSNRFTEANWGFQTRRSGYQLVSTGRYGPQSVEARCSLYTNTSWGSIHALFVHALYAGNSSGSTNYIMKVGGTGTAADFVHGDAYSGCHVELSGDSTLRLPEFLVDTNSDGICSDGEVWTNAYAVQVFTNGLTQAQFDAYKASMAPYMDDVYNNQRYDYGEAFVDTIGNGVYNLGEPFTDSNGNGRWDAGDTYIDRNGNGVYNAGVDTVVDNGNGRWDAGEEWTEDSDPLHHSKRINGKYDPAGGYYKKSGSSYIWTTTKYKVSGVWYYPATWPAEVFEDVGDGVLQAAEVYVDQNGVYDEGEEYLDDRNSLYDYGTQARKTITGMPSPGPGQMAATGNNAAISPPDLLHMYYATARTAAKPSGALERWGNDVAVTASDYGTAKAITDTSRPEHIFVRNPPTSGSTSSGGKTIYGRSYTALYNTSGQRIDDYFLEDPADSSYNSSVSADSIDGTTYTAPMYVNVNATGNAKLYYVEGNVYIHHPQVYSLRFRQPGTRITIVAKGNITISDEFYYNADYADDLVRADMDSTIVKDPSDALCLIALKNTACTNSGNIYIGDRQFGTGGSIHALLYAENDFVDNNINSVDQQFISIFGNMTAGNQIRLNREVGSGHYRTRLDVTLDERIRDGVLVDGEYLVPGLPHPVGGERGQPGRVSKWFMKAGTWSSWSYLK